MVSRWATLAVLVVSCSPAQYAFIAHAFTVPNPQGGAALPDGETIAIDGLTHHRWKTYATTETCFESSLADLQPADVLPRREFELWAFRDKAQRIDTVAKLRSDRLTVKGSGLAAIKTEERQMPLNHVDVEVCFANPERIIMPTTTYVVLKVPYDSENEPGVGSRDGVWQLRP
jgi:hypothetical protein